MSGNTRLYVTAFKELIDEVVRENKDNPLHSPYSTLSMAS